MSDVELVTEEGLPVALPSGATFRVLTQEEVSYVQERVSRYLHDNHFVNVSDFQDVDRMLMMELLCYRWAQWISRGRDYFNDPIDEPALRRSLNDYSGEVRQLKKILSIDKKERDRQRGDDSVPVFLENLLARAKEFGVVREEQCTATITLGMELVALVTLHDNCDETERREMHVGESDVLEWIRTVFIPELRAKDDYFREHKQRYWVRTQ